MNEGLQYVAGDFRQQSDTWVGRTTKFLAGVAITAKGVVIRNFNGGIKIP
jgi:hypothetical protein